MRFHAAFLLTVLFLSFPLPASACQLAPDHKPDPAAAPHIFIGRIVSATTLATPDSGGGRRIDALRVVFAVQKDLKGSSQPGEVLTVTLPLSSCSVDFSAGQTWLFMGGRIGDGSQLLADENGAAYQEAVSFVKETFNYDFAPQSAKE